MNQFPPRPWVYHKGRFEFFRKFAEIFAAQGWPPVSTTPVALPLVSTTPAAKLPPVSTTPAANFATSCCWYRWQICHRCRWYRWSTLSCEYLREFSKNCHRCCWHRRQFATGINDTGGKFATGVVDTGGKQWDQYQAADTLKWTWRQKCIYVLTLLSKGVQTKLLKFFWLKIFLICHRCQQHWWSTLSCEYLREFSKKIWNGPTGILWGWGETDWWKKPEAKNLVTLSL